MTAIVAAGRFLTVQGMPMLVLEGTDELLATGRDSGLRPLPALFGADFPRGAALGLTLTRDDLRLEDEAGVGLLRVPRPSIDPAWLSAALRLRGTMLVVAVGVDLDPDADDLATCRVVDTAARAGRAVGAIVGVAEPREGLPLMFG